jgi:thiamine pyrophosphate-dependent acetolactate synthase large subunit-like protein
MILIGGASETYRRGMGTFQEERQVLLAAPLCKFAHAIDSVRRIPYYVAEATRNATYGRPGAAYLDMPDDIITGKCDEKDVVQVQKCPDRPRFQAPPENVDAALNMLERAERPLILVGKRMAWANAENEVRAFIEKTQAPFLGGRHLGIAERRRRVSDGARFNWIFDIVPFDNEDAAAAGDLRALAGLVGRGATAGLAYCVAGG